MSVIRAFIAVDLAPEILQELERVTADLKQRLGRAQVRWVVVKNIHLTLKFLGDVSVSNLDILQKMLQVETGKHLPFEFAVGGAGAFPSVNRPRVIWVGVQAPAGLNSLQHGIDTEAARLGYNQEERPFSPHLTLGRVPRNATPQDTRQISAVLAGYQLESLGVTQVNEVHLYRSDLQPGGAVYTKLFSAALSAP